MRSAFACIAVLGLGLGGCDNGKSHLHPEAGMDAPPPPWWRPTLGEAKDWDIQLSAPFELTARMTMYDLNLWDVVPAATQLDYGDATPVTVPAGSQPTAIATLHARGVKVVCHFDTGAIHLKDPDAKKFPGFKATGLPNRPAAPEAGSVIGWSVSDTGADDDHRFLDVRATARPLWIPYMLKRFDLAKTIGCDGIDADQNITTLGYSGFDVAVTDTFSWHGVIAEEAHTRELAAGVRSPNGLTSLVDETAPVFDFAFVDRCGEIGDCDALRPFIQRGRVVFAIDYQTDLDGEPNLEAGVCQNQQRGQIVEGLVKDDAISSTYRKPCVP